MTKKKLPQTDINRTVRANLRRDVLPHGAAEPQIKPVFVDWNLNAQTVVLVGDAPKLSIDLQAIKRESAEHHRIIYDLLFLLSQQSWVAGNAVLFANGPLGTIEAQSTAGRDRAAKLRKEWGPRQRELRAEATKRWVDKPRRSTENMAARLASEAIAGYTSQSTVADLIRDLKPKATPKK